MGFYINHLKSPAAKRYARIIEKQVADHTGVSTVIKSTFANSGSHVLPDLRAAAVAAYLDHPEWFHISREFRFEQLMFSVTVNINIMYTPGRVRTLSKQVDEISRAVTDSIPTGLTQWEKELRIYQYLQENVTYSTEDGECYGVVGALVNRRACCEGVSKAFALLCHRVGINCITVMDSDHMWNIVQLGGITANVDITPGLFSDGIDYAYFNVTDHDIAPDHGKAIRCVPRCTDLSMSYYAVNHTLFNNESELAAYLIRNSRSGKSTVSIKLLEGSIMNAVRKASLFLLYSPRLTYSERTNTAEILL